MDEDMQETGLSQQMDTVGLSASSASAPSQLQDGGTTVVVPPPSGPRVKVNELALAQLVENEALQHFELVQAAVRPEDRAVPLLFPRTWLMLERVLKKLAYFTNSDDDWKVLGFALYEGPEPSPQSLHSRARVAQILLSLAQQTDWIVSCKNAAAKASARIDHALTSCLDNLEVLLWARETQKTSKLPLYKELGQAAVELLEATAENAGEWIVTQWSELLETTLRRPVTIDRSRQLAAMSERGDKKVLDELKGQAATLWLPADKNQATRLLKNYLSRTEAAQRPTSLRMIVPVPLYPEVSSVKSLLDLWTCYLMDSQWAPIVVSSTVTLTPMDMVLPGRDFPRSVRMGLAIFSLGHDGDKIPMQIFEHRQPRLTVVAAKVAVLDVPTTVVTRLMAALNSNIYADALVRDPVRSPLSTKLNPRMVINLIYDNAVWDQAILYGLNMLRDLPLGAGTYIYTGLRSIIADSASLILEIGDPSSMEHYWPLCSQAVAITPSKLAIFSTTEKTQWVATFDAVFQSNPQDTVALLRAKQSQGGRAIATPSGTRSSLAATRRGGNRKVTSQDYVTTVTAQGELGREDNALMCQLLLKVSEELGLGLAPAADPECPKTGEFYLCSAVHAAARPGMMRILLPDVESVKKVKEALHGQSMKVGMDTVGITVANDLLDARAAPGGRNRRNH